jgi:hypothetical protein
VIVGTVRLLTGIAMQTRLDLEKVRVELLFLPSVAEGTSIVVLATVFVGGNELLGMPVRAHILAIGKDGGIPAVVLPVVGVDTDVPLVVVLSVRTPHGLEVKDIEIHIWLELLYELDRELPLVVCKGAKFSVVAFALAIEIGRAKLGLVLVWMVEFLDSIVCLVAVVLIRALLVLVYV